MNTKEANEAFVTMVASGHAILQDDGTWKLSEEAHDALTKLINEQPELYPLIFPNRVN